MQGWICWPRGLKLDVRAESWKVQAGGEDWSWQLRVQRWELRGGR